MKSYSVTGTIQPGSSKDICKDELEQGKLRDMET